MKIWKKRKTKLKNKKNNNRANVVFAIIFLLVLAILYKLYDLQFVKNSYYVALASQQHEVSSQLYPQRGKIFIQDTNDDVSNGSYYPLATNKEFGIVFAKPNIIKKEDAPAIAEKLYEVLDGNNAVSPITEGTSTIATSTAAELSEDMLKMKREIEQRSRKDVIVEGYIKSLTKENAAYVPIAKKVDESKLEKLKELKLEGIDYTMESYRFYPENEMGSHMLGFVGYSGDDRKGRYGLEGFFDEELQGKLGSIKAERDARGALIIVNNMQYDKPVNGSDLILTINRSIQFMACQKLKEAAEKHGADNGTVIIMDPSTGAIIAMCSYPDYNPNDYEQIKEIKLFNNPAIFNQYEPGSVFKSLTMAAALNEGKVTPDTTYKDDGSLKIDRWTIKNSDFATHGGHGISDMNTVLEYSLNTGAIFAMRRIGANTFADYVEKFGFGEKTGIELEGESKGNINNLLTKKIRDIDSAVASFGQGISVTPLQMINAYAALANGGILMKPFLVKEIVHNDGTKDITQPVQVRRVISERTAALITGMMINVVEKGHAKGAQMKGYYVAGKTGTAQEASADSKGYGVSTIHSFIAFAPANDPKFVMLTKLDHPKDKAFAESTAVPLFNDIASFVIHYYQIPADRKDNEKKK